MMAGWFGRASAEALGRRLAEQEQALAALADRTAAAGRAAEAREAAGGGETAALGGEVDRLRARCAALEAGLAGLEARLAEARDVAERACAGRDAAEARLARLEERDDRVPPLVTAALVRRLEAEAAGGDAPDVPSALHRLDQQFKAHAADTDRALRALALRLAERG